MPRAVSKDTRIASGVQPTFPAITNIDPSGLPDVYGMRVSGNCMLPEIVDEDLLCFDRREPVNAGDLVIIYFRPELIAPGDFQAKVKRLVTAVPHYVTFPWSDNPASDVDALIIAETLNPRQHFAYACSAILAVHKCMGHLPEDRVTEKIPAPKLRPGKARRAREAAQVLSLTTC